MILEDGAEATLLAETGVTDPAAAGLHCGAVELFVGRGAGPDTTCPSIENSDVWHGQRNSLLLSSQW